MSKFAFRAGVEDGIIRESFHTMCQTPLKPEWERTAVVPLDGIVEGVRFLHRFRERRLQKASDGGRKLVTIPKVTC
jgi:hypothetical protein